MTVSSNEIPVMPEGIAGKVIDRLAIGAIVVREPVAGNRWVEERWRIHGLVSGEAMGGERRRQVLREGPEGTQYLWSGLELVLHPGDAENYYYNLLGSNPSLYVYCEHDPGGELVPVTVSADYIDAMWHQEFGNETHAVPIPPEVYRIVEQFVMAHYTPDEPRRKRKRDAPSGTEERGE